jgi:hypothetical protein
MQGVLVPRISDTGIATGPQCTLTSRRPAASAWRPANASSSALQPRALRAPTGAPAASRADTASLHPTRAATCRGCVVQGRAAVTGLDAAVRATPERPHLLQVFASMLCHCTMYRLAPARMEERLHGVCCCAAVVSDLLHAYRDGPCSTARCSWLQDTTHNDADACCVAGCCCCRCQGPHRVAVGVVLHQLVRGSAGQQLLQDVDGPLECGSTSGINHTSIQVPLM